MAILLPFIEDFVFPVHVSQCWNFDNAQCFPVWPFFNFFELSRSILTCHGKMSYLASPDLMCKPSTFWLIIYWTKFSSTSLTKAMCVIDGLASSNVVSICGAFPFSSKVQTPFGPLKSGIPADVLTPAPVWNTMCLASRKSFVNSAILISSCSGESKSCRIDHDNCIRSIIFFLLWSLNVAL